MAIIEVNVVDQLMTVTNEPIIASGDKNEDKVKFTFDSSWNGYAKIAAFYQNKGELYYSLVGSDNCAVVPFSAMTVTGNMVFGVIGISETKTKTTKVLRYKIDEGIIDGFEPDDPSPDIYEQMLTKYGEVIAQYQTVKERLDEQDEKLEEIQTTGATAEVIENKVQTIIDDMIADGTMAAMTIEDGSITKEKLDPEINLDIEDGSITLNKLGSDIVNGETVETITGEISDFGWTSGKLGATDDAVTSSGGSYSRMIDVTPHSVLKLYTSVDTKTQVTIRHYDSEGSFIYECMNVTATKEGAEFNVGYASKIRLQTGSAWVQQKLTAFLLSSDADNNKKIKAEAIDVDAVAETMGVSIPTEASCNLYNNETMGFNYGAMKVGGNYVKDVYTESTTIRTVCFPVDVENEKTYTLASTEFSIDSFALLLDAEFNVLYSGNSMNGNTTCPYSSVKVVQAGSMNMLTFTLLDSFLSQYPTTAYLAITTKIASTDYENMMAVAGGQANVPFEYVPYKVKEDFVVIPNLKITKDNLGDDIALLLSGSTSGLPVMKVYGDTTGMTKDVEKSLTYVLKGKNRQLTGFCTMKWQGSSSIQYDKKNYTIKLHRDSANSIKHKVDMDLNAGEQSKYCLKANYIDHTHARNIVNAQLWGDIVNLRTDIPELMKQSPNMCAVDGYPFLMYINDEYHGLYTFNIPKDGYMFDMDEDNPLHCAVCAESNDSTGECAFRVASVGQWSVEFPDAYTDTTKNSLLAVINFVMNSTDDEFKAGINDYLDLASILDYYIFAYVNCNIDGLGKNMILLTYDAVKWYCSAYDMDSTWGLFWNGSKLISSDTQCPEGYEMTGSLLWERIEALFPAELYARYKELRITALSEQNISDRFNTFCGKISDEIYKADADMYSIPLVNSNNLKQVLTFVNERLAYCDEQFELFNS